MEQKVEFPNMKYLDNAGPQFSKARQPKKVKILPAQEYGCEQSYEFTRDKCCVNGGYYCYCVYEWKDNLKKLGFKWDPPVRRWYIPKQKFHKELYYATQEIRYVSHTTGGTMYYYFVYYVHQLAFNNLKK